MASIASSAESLAKKGATWARVDLISIIPAERGLYLDADTLIVKDIQDLWKTDLNGNGRGAVGEGSYFNAEVLLVGLVNIRRRMPDVKQLARSGVQDVLNVHFRKEWHEFSTWNAQGMGTYVDGPSANRTLIAKQLEERR